MSLIAGPAGEPERDRLLLSVEDVDHPDLLVRRAAALARLRPATLDDRELVARLAMHRDPAIASLAGMTGRCLLDEHDPRRGEMFRQVLAPAFAVAGTRADAPGPGRALCRQLLLLAPDPPGYLALERWLAGGDQFTDQDEPTVSLPPQRPPVPWIFEPSPLPLVEVVGMLWSRLDDAERDWTVAAALELPGVGGAEPGEFADGGRPCAPVARGAGSAASSRAAAAASETKPGGNGRGSMVGSEAHGVFAARPAPGGDPLPLRSVAAMWSLWWRPAPDGRFTTPLVARLRQADPVVAGVAALALAAAGDRRVERVFQSMLREGGPVGRQTVLVAALALLAGADALPSLLPLLTASEAPLRLAAVRWLARLPVAPATVAERLQPCLRDPDSEVRAAAASTLWGLGSMTALPLILEMLESAEVEARVASAGAALALPAGIAVPALMARLAREKTGDVQRAIILTLRAQLRRDRVGDDERDRFLALLARLAEQPAVHLQVQAWHLAGSLGPSAESWLLEGLRHPGPEAVVATQLAALARVSSSSRLLIGSRFIDHPDARVRANLMVLLAREGNPASGYLARALQDPSPRVRASAAVALWQLGQIEVVGLLTRMLATGNLGEICAAAYALAVIGRQPPWPRDDQQPLGHALHRLRPRSLADAAGLPAMLADDGLVDLLSRLAPLGIEERTAVLRRAMAAAPAAYPPRRLLSYHRYLAGDRGEALQLLADCQEQHPDSFADQLERFRLALLVGDLGRTTTFGMTARDTWTRLVAACEQAAVATGGAGAVAIQAKLHRLRQPSLNLYAVMIQLANADGDAATAVTLLAELFFARPDNPAVVDQLRERLPPTAAALRRALAAWRAALPAPSPPAAG